MFLQGINETMCVEPLAQALELGKLKMLNAPPPLRSSSAFCSGEVELAPDCVMKEDLDSHSLAPQSFLHFFWPP